VAAGAAVIVDEVRMRSPTATSSLCWVLPIGRGPTPPPPGATAKATWWWCGRMARRGCSSTATTSPPTARPTAASTPSWRAATTSRSPPRCAARAARRDRQARLRAADRLKGVPEPHPPAQQPPAADDRAVRSRAGRVTFPASTAHASRGRARGLEPLVALAVSALQRVSEEQMHCPRCETANADGARCCGECGASLARDVACSACGHANPVGQKFCNRCGQRLGEATAPAARDPRAYTPKHL